MRKHLTTLIILLGTFVSFAATAAESSAELANRYVVLMRYPDQYTEYHRQCLAAAKSVTPESLVKQNPDYFAGIQPGDSRWPEVVKAYSLYYEEGCQHPTQKEFLSTMASAYASQLSPDDLQEAIRYYSSPLGQRLIAAHKVAVQYVYEELNRLNSQQLPIAIRNLNDRVIEISNQGRGQ
jgi:hypothetical protein